MNQGCPLCSLVFSFLSSCEIPSMAPHFDHTLLQWLQCNSIHIHKRLRLTLDELHKRISYPIPLNTVVGKKSLLRQRTNLEMRVTFIKQIH